MTARMLRALMMAVLACGTVLCLMVGDSAGQGGIAKHAYCGTLQCKAQPDQYQSDSCTCTYSGSTESFLTCLTPSDLNCTYPNLVDVNYCNGKCNQDPNTPCWQAYVTCP